MPELSKYATTVPRNDDGGLFRTLLSLVGNPALIEGKLKFPYQRFTLPIGDKTAFTAERGLGLYGQEFIPDINERDLRFTLSRNFQDGGLAEPLRKTPKRKRERFREFLTDVSEKNSLLDFLYHSPEESFDRAFGSSVAFGVAPRANLPGVDKGELELVKGEGLKDLWRQAGSPRVKTHDKSYAAYMPSEAEWLYGKRNPLSFMKMMFGSDKMYLPKGEFGGADKGVGISELAHGMRFADPEQFSKYKTRKELVLGKGQEHAEQELYSTPGTDEYATHREVEPILRDWLIKNYLAGF